MKIAIIFATSRGTTEKAVHMLRNHLQHDVDVFNLKSKPTINLDAYDAIILGSSIHAGTIQAKIKKFMEANLSSLTGKKLGLFLCCMEQGEKAQQQFDTGFPEELRKQSVANGLFGGELIFANMNFFERFIVKKIGGTASDAITFDPEKVASFAENFQSAS